MKAGLYKIEDFSTENGEGQSGYGFSIVLSAVAVEAILKLKREEGGASFIETLRERIQNSFPDFAASTCDPPQFFEETWLLTLIKVPGTCACMGVGGDTISWLEAGNVGAIRYVEHNIDTIEQAACILSVWLLWFNTILALTDIEQPYTSR